MSRARLLRRLYPGPRAGEAVANPYRDELPRLDAAGAARQRRRNLEAYLEAVGGVRCVLVGEAMGYQGGRFSGIAFTSERQLAGPDGVRLAWVGQGIGATSRKASLWTEPSGTIVWKALGGEPRGVLLWNAFPWHPHLRGRRLTNRTPRAPEVEDGLRVLEAMLDWAQPDRVAAVGRVAALALGRLGVAATPLRHPARGGARQFHAGFASLGLEG